MTKYWVGREALKCGYGRGCRCGHCFEDRFPYKANYLLEEALKIGLRNNYLTYCGLSL